MKRKDDKVDLALSYEEVSKSFFEPYPISQLGGKPGLTATDIAKILRIRLAKLLEKLRRGKTAEMLKVAQLQMIPFRTLNENRVLYEDIAFETKAAELVIAKYDNRIGWMYLRFLQASKEFVPHALKHIQKLEKDLKDLESKFGSPIKPVRKDALLEVTVSQSTEKSFLFGDTEVAKTIRKTRDEMTPSEQNLYGLQQGVRQSLGILKKCRDRIGKLLAPDDDLVSYGDFIIDYMTKYDKLVNKTGLRKVQINNEHPHKMKLDGVYLQIPLFGSEAKVPEKIN